MTEKFENILDRCLQRITLKGESIEACLKDYPEHAFRLEPLLRTAVSTAHCTRHIKARPELKVKAKNQMLMELQHRQQEQVKVVRGFTWKRSWALAAILLILLLAGSGTVMASSDSLPGQPLYPVKTTMEKVQLKLTPSDLDKAKLHAKFAERRVEEMVAMEKRKKAQEVEKLAQRAKQELNHMAILAESLKARKNGEGDVERLRTRLEQSSVLASSDSLPDQPLYPVKIAVEETLLKLTTSELSQARLRIEFAERRVQEMVEIGKSDKPQELEELAQSVEQQLDQIEPLAESLMSQKNKERDVEEIKTLLEQAAIRNPDVLRETLEKVPIQARPALEQALERSRLRYEKELESLNEIKQRTEHKPNSREPQPNPPGQFK